MAYTIPTRRLLQGRANVHRIPMNGSSTDVGMAHLDAWLGSGKWDVIHFNWGLHDLTVLLGQGGLKNDGSYLVPLDRYEKNLRELVRRLKGTGATLIWATTTPIPHADKTILLRISVDEIAYNAVARKIMEENGIAIDDLYAFALPRLKAIQLPNNVHFTDEGSEELAKQVASSILDALKTRKRDE
jgi:acyl-CoA thioesterase-1